MQNNTEFVILSVDDSRDDREIFRRILEHKGYLFLQAYSIEDAKDLMKNKIPHLILLDIEIGEDKGFSFLSYLKNEKLYENIPVIMVSNHVSSELVAEAISGGACDYIVKPVNSISLIERIEKKLSAIMKIRGESYSIDDKEKGKSILRFNVNISRISEYGAFIVSNNYFRWPQSVTLTSDILQEINMNTMPKRIVKTFVSDDKIRNRFPGQKYESFLTYVGLSDDDAKKIRKYIIENLTGIKRVTG